MREYVSIEEAVTSLLGEVSPAGTETVSIADANRRVLAEDIAACVDLPPFHRSAYDGFALRSADTQSASKEKPIRFPVIGMIAAGDFWTETLPSGCAVRIMTGAPLPEGADCVINFERVTEEGDAIYLPVTLSPWQNVDKKGDELQAGTPLLCAGELLTPAHLGVLASQGIAKVSVYRKPRAAILSTGTELLSPGTALQPGKIYNSNLYVLRALLEQEGYEVGDCIHMQDDEQSICETLRRLSESNDLILTTGGASVGDKDFALNALEQVGADVLFARVRMKPGSCTFGAKLGKALAVSFSGNPGAALTAYYRVVLPAIRKLAGRRDCTLHERMLPIQGGYRKSCPSPRILKGHTETVGGVTCFVAHDGQKNGMQTSFLRMDALAELPPMDAPLAEGTLVRVFFPEVKG